MFSNFDFNPRNVEDVVTVDKSKPDENFGDDNLKVGSPDGTTSSEKRILVKFNGEQFDIGKSNLDIQNNLTYP